MKRNLLTGLIALAALGVVVAVGASWWFTQPVDRGNSQEQTFIIPAGASVSRIARDLEEAKLIRSSLVFRAYVWNAKLSNSIQAGSFTLSPNMPLAEVAQTLTKGTSDVWITITEGQRAEEIGEQLAQVLPNFDVESDAFQTECVAHEGRLFPETYLVPKQYSTTQACQLLRREFDKRFAPLAESVARQTQAHDITEDEFITLASLVEREAKSSEDRKKVAGVLFNRLEIGMPLQIDATLQYAKGYDSKNKTWWSPPVSIDKNVASPYNTYKNAGLPPGPIANPSLNALTAVGNPTPSDYLFYLTAPDGTTYFTETYEEHQANIARYLR